VTEEEIQAFLSMGTTEDEISELLRQAERQEGIGDATRGKDYTLSGGNGYIANNSLAPIADIFVRGNAEKKAKEAQGQAANKRATLDERTRDYMRAASGLGLGGVDLRSSPTQSQIAGSKPLNIKPAPPVPPPPAAPAPPKPAAPRVLGPQDLGLPTPAKPAPAPQGPQAQGAPGIPGGMQSPPVSPFMQPGNPFMGAAGGDQPTVEELMAELAKRNPSMPGIV
jgi:hypothetical protein